MLGNGLGIIGEYIIPIKINVQNEKDNFQEEILWDLLNEESK